jgi:hypothetical protein
MVTRLPLRQPQPFTRQTGQNNITARTWADEPRQPGAVQWGTSRGQDDLSRQAVPTSG